MPGSGWQRFKELPTIVASLLAVAAALISVAVWVTGYFATQEQLNRVRCILDGNLNLISLQVESGNLYSRYVNTKVKMEELTRDGVSQEQRSAMIELEAESKRLWSHLTTREKEADKLATRLKSGRCET